jgi:tRNA(Arg) A34 adenosine deaminase TadA
MGALDAWEQLDRPWRASFELAWEAFADGTVPVGAVVVDENDAVVAQGRNRIFADSAPAHQIAGTRLAHAELNALAQLSTDRRWDSCTLYTTLEPCVLCVAATSVATVGRIRFAGAAVHSGSSNLAGMDLGIPRPLNLTVEGPLEGPFELLGAALHLAFFVGENAGPPPLVESYSARRPSLFALARSLLRVREASLTEGLMALDQPTSGPDAGAGEGTRRSRGAE